MYEGTIREKLDVGKKSLLFYHFWIVIKICSALLQKKFGTVVRTAFHVKRWSFQERTNLSNKTETFDFFGNWSVKFTELGESIMYGCQNWILHVRRNNSRKNWCWGKSFTVFITFEIESKYVRSSCGEVSARGSKLLFTSSDDPPEKEEQISWITHNFFFENSSVKFTEFDGEASCTVVKTAFYM